MRHEQGLNMHTMTKRLLTPGLVVVSAALLAVGCGDDSNSSDAKDTKTTTTAAADAKTDEAADDANNGIALRITLDRLLGEHMLLAANATQKALLGGKDVTEALGALEANTNELSDAVGSIYGEDAKSAFKGQWAAHNLLFVDYTTAVAKKDAASKAAAVKGLGKYQTDFGKFFAEATGLPVPAVQQQLGVHVGHTAKGVDNFAAKKYDVAYADLAMGYEHMFALGDTLAAAIAEQQELNPTTGDAADLQVTLDRLLSQHAMLAIIAMQRGFDGSPDFAAAGKALDANTDDLGAAIGSVYGPDAQKAFETQWRAHIQLFVDYTVASAKKDDAGKAKALDGLTAYKTSFAKFLSDATGLDASAGADALQAHVDQLVASFDAYVEGDYEKAYSQAREGYAHMFMTGEALAGAIATQKDITNGGGAMTSSSGGGGAMDDHSDM
ncbi:MAG: hypothetical protein JWM90_2738 [Thermoleophilia bacterium]|nr:hypothetical protein [Thermoleophilia bacterium]